MRTQSLVPRPKTTVIGLEARVHKRAGMADTVFFPAALGKAYEHEHHVGKALHSAVYFSYTKNSLLTALVNCKARMVSYQYDSFRAAAGKSSCD